MLKLEIVTPEKLVFSHEVGMATLPGVEGEFGVLENHSPLIAELQNGEINVFDKADSTAPRAKFRLAGGFAQVTATTCTVLSDTCEVLNDHISSGAAITQLKKK